jgi:hypothetical protein
VLIANTPEFPARSPQLVSNSQFAPRLGLAYQLTPKTVIRAYGGKMYLPSTGNPNSYATSNSNVALSDQAFAGWHASTDGGRHYISTWDTPFPLPSMFSSYTRDTKTVNLQSSLDPGANVVSRTLHMPREYSFSVDVQHELPYNVVVQLGYAGNRGYGLLATNTESHYPADLLQPQYAAMMQGFLLSPNAGQTLETTITGTTQQLGLLEYQYPYYGRVQVSGLNLGRSAYDAMNLRVERRFSNGLSILMNYTLSRLNDDVGGADGQGSKTVQSIDSYHAAWGISSLDRTHKLNIAYTYEFPFGKGKAFMNNPAGLVSKVLDSVVGGWTLAGNYAYASGDPPRLNGSTTSNINNTIKVNQTWASYASSDQNLLNPAYTGPAQVLYGPVQQVTSSSVTWLDPTKVVGAQAFISGNLPPTLSAYRNPGNYQMDMSLMKNFKLGESRFLQIRGEAQNAWNVRGYGAFQTSIGNPDYGIIRSAGNDPRQIQLSARFGF